MIYADENVWYPVVEGLRRRGWEVTTTRDEGKLGASDADQLRYAASNEWIVLTFDDDLLSLAETTLSDTDHAGIIYAPQRGRDVGDFVRRIDSTLQQLEDLDPSNETFFA